MTLFWSKRDTKRRAILYNSTTIRGTTVELSFGLLVRSVRLGTMKQFDNNKNHSFKKPRDLISKSRLDCTGFNRPRRDVLRERLQEVREKERAAKEAEKERQKAARDAEKAIQLS